MNIIDNNYENMDFYKKKMGKNIQDIRNDKNLTLNNLAELSNISPGTISMLETGSFFRTRFSTIFTILKALGLNEEDFLKNIILDIPFEVTANFISYSEFEKSCLEKCLRTIKQ
ncbi:Transcriptional regulator, contains XRE-family HTH domain [Acetoanaerobium noterae]|uniref:Transcriptional regulator, contains XRE-family HTH domain n=2 Tax=Acetoanaerobium noterae TaxID=745369 RepID=A0A1T5DRQ3_9FIRM|nr:Transcriptional regulator, contains XRE-family HTH domain [Acetoanaerobium noterae]